MVIEALERIPAELATPMLELDDIVVSFDGFTVLNNLSLSVARGELRFLIGPNGAGKTTLLDLLTGKTRPVSGKATYDGHVDITKQAEHKLVRMGIGRKFQTPAVYKSLTCLEHLEVALGFRRSLPALFGSLGKRERERIRDALTMVGLLEQAHTKAGALSHGEQQWLEIAMLLVQDPKLLLLDEPVAGMTRPEREKTGELLNTLAGLHTIIVTEHDMDFVRRFARRVTVLHMGSVLTEGSIDEVQQNESVVEVYLGRSHGREHDGS
jgi:urea transport system ATP-binding protein